MQVSLYLKNGSTVVWSINVSRIVTAIETWYTHISESDMKERFF